MPFFYNIMICISCKFSYILVVSQRYFCKWITHVFGINLDSAVVKSLSDFCNANKSALLIVIDINDPVAVIFVELPVVTNEPVAFNEPVVTVDPVIGATITLAVNALNAALEVTNLLLLDTLILSGPTEFPQ